jgi:hypothetical protein
LRATIPERTFLTLESSFFHMVFQLLFADMKDDEMASPIVSDEVALLLMTGNYGSGKTEVSVNLVSSLARAGRNDITIADLDLVNPYFRSREARGMMTELGIRVVAPEADLHNADLPILLPEVRGAIEQAKGLTVLDVGGDNVGATVLAAIAPSIRSRKHKMWFVLNQSRPFTGDLDGAMQIMDEIEHASRLKINGIVGNTHMMEETTLGMIADGAEFCTEVAERRGIEVAFVTAHRDLLDSPPEDGTLDSVDGIPVPVMALDRIMLPPWLGGAPPGSMATHSRDGFARITGADR